jgi:hypothetical protein
MAVQVRVSNNSVYGVVSFEKMGTKKNGDEKMGTDLGTSEVDFREQWRYVHVCLDSRDFMSPAVSFM